MTDDLDAMVARAIDCYETHKGQCSRDYSMIAPGDGAAISVSMLATGDDAGLMEWAMNLWPDTIDRRGQTVRWRAWIYPDNPLCSAEPVFRRIVEMSHRHNVTIQLICAGDVKPETSRRVELGVGASVVVAEVEEHYPVIYQAIHGMKWGK